MTDYDFIYRHRADDYERLVAREDYEGNLLRAIEALISLDELDVVETGAGTGRLTALLAPRVRSITAFDLSRHMLAVAEAKLTRSGLTNWRVDEADHRHLPVADASADLVISGWSICYLALSGPGWQDELTRGLVEFQRVLKPGGKIIIIETLGTGYEFPERYEVLTPYFEFLESHGFQSTFIRTDYHFRDLDEAKELSAFFFGDELAQQVVEKNWVILPECTGLWWK